MKNFKRISVIALTLIILFLPSISRAHGLFLTLEEPGVLKAEYDGGGFSPRMEVVIYDANGNELDRGKVDENGEFHFDPSLDVASAEVDDQMGHHATYEAGKTQTQIPKLPVVIAVFVVVAIIFVVNGKKKSNKSTE